MKVVTRGSVVRTGAGGAGQGQKDEDLEQMGSLGAGLESGIWPAGSPPQHGRE